ncbi:MAG TPA: transketolase C-terminal domain-containing protein, partial [Spirochaetia bacterium]|nr:transketolase C-terminal domain-containing protein [Spirochaetia bacterium]
LGPEEAAAAKKAIGVPDGCQFYIFPEAQTFFQSKQPAWKARYEEWKKSLEAWKRENPDKAKEWARHFEDGGNDLSSVTLPSFKVGETLATRAAGGQVLNALARAVPNLIGGSADLAPSNSTNLKDMGDFSASNPLGRNFHFGIREHGMGGISNGIAYHGGLRPFCATFLVFSDYMRPAIRLAAIAKLPVIYVFTHDSVFVGEDGPTHEPVEHLAALRAVPNLLVLRPGDAEETEVAWRIAYERREGPTALALTRQGIAVYPKADSAWRATIRKGAYIAKDCDGAPEIVVVATGSEVSAAIAAAAELRDRKVRIVSMLSRELFVAQPADFRLALVPARARKVTFEAGVSFGWKGPFDDDSVSVVSIERFGESGPYQKIAEHLGITAAALVKRIREL